MNLLKTTPLQKTIISAAVATALSLGSTTTQADIYEFTYANGGCFVSGTTDTCTGPGDALFTMLTSAGAPLQNNSYPYWGDTTWGYGLRTQIGGSLSYDSTTRAGAAIINPFDFNGSGPAVASSITFTKQAASNLMLAQMKFDWNANPPINTEVVWDGSGLFAALPTIAINDTINLASCTGGSLDGQCAMPASDGMKGALPIGAVPIATSTFNVAGVVNGVGTPTLGADDGIGGSPMDNGPFADFNANFDFASLTMSGFNDTTAPTITLGGAANNSITVPLGAPGSFDVNNPDVAAYVHCDDGTDLTDDLDDTVGTNANISFTVGGDTPDGSVAGTYSVTYTCTDNASRWTAINDDPNNPGSATTPADNTSSTATLTVKVNATPVANTDYDQTLASDGTLVIDFATTDLTGGDLIATDANSDTMTFSSVSATTNGGIVTNNGTDLLYTPALPGSTYVGPDSFTYTVNDGTIDSGTGTVNLDVTNVLPAAVDDGSNAQTTATVTINLVGNDSDYEDDINGVPLVTLVNISATAQDADGSSVSDNGDGTVDYTAPNTFIGDDPFTYQVQDSNGGLSNTATVTVAITATPNLVPTSNDVAYNTDAGTPLDITFASVSDTDGTTLPGADGDGDTLIFTNVAGTTGNGGAVTGNNTGTLTYTPADGFNSTDTISFTADDGKGGVSIPANTITITVNSMVPVANDDPGLSMLLGGTLNIDVAANDTDVEDDATVTALVTVTPGTPDNGGAAAAVVAADGTIDFTPVAVGVESFTYTVTDSDTNISTPATVTVTVTAAPVTSDIALATDEDVALTTISLPNILIATDGDGDALTYDTFDATTTQGGTVTING
ncbi:MAG: tandem-95 repeat protein, partial [Gammaproteobacteria bacterium]|nr:tandem-95 repeat protein [Gammaproteobacteria bacterium]